MDCLAGAGLDAVQRIDAGFLFRFRSAYAVDCHPVFGFAMSIGEGVERAVMGDHAKPDKCGALFGWYYALVVVASSPAGLIIGALWQVYGAPAAYGIAAIVGFVAALILHFGIAAQILRSADR